MTSINNNINSFDQRDRNKIFNQTKDNKIQNNQLNINDSTSLIEQIKAKINDKKDKLYQDLTSYCDAIFQEFQTILILNNQIQLNKSISYLPQGQSIQMQESQMQMISEDNSLFQQQSYNQYEKESYGNYMEQHKNSPELQSFLSEIEQKVIHQEENDSLKQKEKQVNSSTAVTEYLNDQQGYKENVNKYQKQIKKRKTIHKELVTKINQRVSKKKDENKYEEKAEEKKEDKLSFKNQVKGFISNYFKRLSKQIKGNFLDNETVPIEMFERMRGTYKKTDLFLLVNQFFQSNEPTKDEYESCINNTFGKYYDELKPNEDIMCDEEYLKKLQDLKIKQKELLLLIDLKTTFKKFNQKQGDEAYQEFLQFKDYYNGLTVFFRKDIYKYLMSQSYVYTVCIKRAEKFNQIYIKNVILNILLNPKILL